MIRMSTLQHFAESVTDSLEAIAEQIETVQDKINTVEQVLSGAEATVAENTDGYVPDPEPVEDEAEDDDTEDGYVPPVEAEDEDEDDTGIDEEAELPPPPPVEVEEDEAEDNGELYAASFMKRRPSTKSAKTKNVTNFSASTNTSRYAKVKDFLNGQLI